MTALESLVSPYVGVVRSLEELLAKTTDSLLPTYSCDAVDDDRLLGAPPAIGGVCGVGLDHASAVAAALGETAERYSLCLVPEGRVVRRRARDLAGAIDPSRFGLFADGDLARPGFPFARFDAEVEVGWIDGWEVRTSSLARVPVELVSLADPVPPGAARVAYATSSGAACAPTLDAAVLKGLLELLERDAFMITWAGRLSLPLLDWSGHPRLAELDRLYFAPSGLDYAAVDLSPFHDVPSVLAVVRAPVSEPAALGVGAGTAATIEDAWWKALSEAFACRAAAARLALLGRGRELHDDGANVAGFDDHILFYADHRRAGRADFLTSSSERVDVREIRPLPRDLLDGIDVVCDRIEAAGSTAYAVEMTAPDIRSLGVRVVKTVAPELCMLDVPHGARFAGNPRLRTAAAALGLARRALRTNELNLDPHPFP